MLVELPDDADASDTIALADRLVAAIRPVAGQAAQVLLHGEGASAWPALRHAARLGFGTRIGLEDTLRLPDGAVARDNAELVSCASHLLQNLRPQSTC